MCGSTQKRLSCLRNELACIPRGDRGMNQCIPASCNVEREFPTAGLPRNALADRFPLLIGPISRICHWPLRFLPRRVCTSQRVSR